MIVKICDSCQKLLFDAGDCCWVTVRERGALLLKRWQSGMAEKSTVSHFCGNACVLEFAAQWLEGKLEEPKVEVIVRQTLASLEETPLVIVEAPAPTAQEQAEQNAILRSLGI